MAGVRRHGRGWQARASVEGVGRSFQSFPLDTPEAEMQAWRRSEKARLELLRETSPTSAGTFASDAARYLRAVKAMPDIANRQREIGTWVKLFGHRRTLAIKPHEIRAQRDTWLLKGPKKVYDKQTKQWIEIDTPLAASTVNHRLRALQNLYTVLFPNQDNPVKRVPEASEPEPEDRSLPYDVIETILAAMPDRGRGERGKKRSVISLTKVRLRLMAYTGTTFAQMALLTGPADFDLAQPAIRTARRRKGKGAAGGWKPVPREAVPAMQAFMDANAYGAFSRHSLRKSWARACAKVGLPHIRPYDLRHSYGTKMLEQTQDLKATQHLLSHADTRTTTRYATRAIPAWLQAAVARVRFRA